MGSGQEGNACRQSTNTHGHPSKCHWTSPNNYTTHYPILIWQAYRCKKNENRQNWSFSSTRNSVSKVSRADIQYLGLKTPLKTVSFQLFCWVPLCQYFKKFDLPGACFVSLVDIDPGSTLCLAYGESSLPV